jgi:hypothetical protein
MSKEFAKVRHDAMVSDEIFPSEVMKLISKDEKGPLLKLVNQLTTKKLLRTPLQLA